MLRTLAIRCRNARFPASSRLNSIAKLIVQPYRPSYQPLRGLFTSQTCLKAKLVASKEPPMPKGGVQASAYRRMKEISDLLNEELTKHFSLQVDLQVYEDCDVVLDSGETHKLNHLGQVSMKNPHTIIISFLNNPGAIRAAKEALIKSSLCVNPVQEGVVLYVNIPRVSRERREALAKDSKLILNDHNKALNDIYTSYDKQNTAEVKDKDERNRGREKLLEIKRSFESLGSRRLDERRKEFLSEEIC